MAEFKPGHTSARQKYQYNQDNIGDAEDKYYPGRNQRMKEGVHFIPLINLISSELLQFNFTGASQGVFNREHGLAAVGPDYLIDALSQRFVVFVAGI